MSLYAVVYDRIVVNIVVANADWANTQTETTVEYTDENPAYIGGDYVDGFFYAPKPFASWIRSNGVWVPPVVMPTVSIDGYSYVWNEFGMEWQLVEISI